MENKKKNTGVTMVGVLTTILIVLKLTKLIDWSWVWVLSPVWISVALGLMFMLIVACMWHNGKD